MLVLPYLLQLEPLQQEALRLEDLEKVLRGRRRLEGVWGQCLPSWAWALQERVCRAPQLVVDRQFALLGIQV